MTIPLLTPTLVRIALPASPAEIRPDTSLADLFDIKREWLRLAENAGYTEMCWQVLHWLGVPVQARAGHDPVLVCRLSNGVALVGSERAEKRLVRSYVERQNAWLMKRSLTAWLESEAGEQRALLSKARERGNVVDQIMYASLPVARLGWEYSDDEQPRLLEDQSTFLPGKWFNAILAALPDAKDKAQASGAEAVAAERAEMLRCLLVGRQI